MNNISDNTAAKVYHVLFVCSHNSARSIMAEGILNSLGSGRFRPTRRAAIQWCRQPVCAQDAEGHAHRQRRLPQQGLGGVRRADAPQLDFVFTVCDKAAGEVCPVWPGQPMTAHWGVADPAAFEGTDEEKARVYWDTALVLKRRIELMLALPLATLDRLAIQREIKDIGAR